MTAAPNPQDLVGAPAPRPGQTTPVITRSWQQWMAENRLRDCSIASMRQTMVAQGFDPVDVDAALREVESHPILAAARRYQQLQRKLESVVANHHALWWADPANRVVEKRAKVSHDEFMHRYVHGSRPVVLTDLAQDWPARTRWTLPALKQRFGHLEVQIQSGREGDPNYEENKLQLVRTVRFGDFVDRVLHGGPSNDIYLTANNNLLRRPEFASLLDDIGPLPSVVDAARLRESSFLWIGPQGADTPLHHDTLLLFHTQFVGRKRWRFISPLQTPQVYNFHGVFSPVKPDAPDLARYPDFAKANLLEVVVEPGETVFLPLGWWHQVSSLDVTVSMSFTNVAAPNTWTYADPNLRDW